KKAVIRRLPVVETLGCADVICSDKTGTLTKNEMKVVKCFGFSKNDDEILKTGALCNNTVYDGKVFKGEATEKALFEAAYNEGTVSEIEKEVYSRIYEIPFNSERKLMTVVHRKESGKYITSVKGAFDVLINKCDAVLINGKMVPMDERYKIRLAEENRDMAKKALRVLGVAMKETKELPDKVEAEKGLTLVGLVGLMDPPREEAKESVALCKKAGIRPVMITGDHILTALAVAGELGIYRENDLYLTGNEIEDMTDDELKKRVPFCTVFARVSPFHKLRIVEAYKNNGSIVAMTGDGVNDAPALKAAHIGCAMGLNGTDVAKGAADMVIMDDNFATIVEAVREGRGIYRNIKKAVHFLVSSNIGEVITIFAAMLFGWSVPLLPIQLLWVNLVTDALPAIALSFEKTDDDIMTIPPLKTETSMFSNGQGLKIALEGIMIGMLALIAFGTGHIYFDAPYEHITGRTMAFAVLSISQLVHVFNVRSERSIFKTGAGGNSLLVIAFVIGIIMQVSVITIPLFASVFGVTVLGFNEWLIVALLSLSPILIVEIEKLFLKRGDS
ncbi:MAG: cation-transporting P-type ATPase, partial [Lachnospiraceae bacterium]|nr:cation-transporting P-type ATPase [Lachnospiraceae bacterium]